MLNLIAADINELMGGKVLVVLANDLPPAVRGRMKLWFVEPRPNVFVSGVKDSVAQTVVDYLLQYTPVESGLMLFRSIPQPLVMKFATRVRSESRLLISVGYS
nr:type I-E CRISPR-associated endoribonuclease Cas2e [Klebsiella pneumoniae subsp. pneumoniae]